MKTMDDAIAALEKVVEKYGAETTYRDRDPEAAAVQDDGTTTCRYVNPQTGEPMCIVGVVLVEQWGMEVGLFKTDIGSARQGVIDNESDTPRLLRFRNTAEVTEEAGEVLLHAQIAQDAGNDWGTSLQRAKSAAEKIRKFKADRMKVMEER